MKSKSSIKSIHQTFRCSQDFEGMAPSEVGRHCGECSTDIIDLVGLSDEEIISYLENLKSSQLCARLSQTQLDSINRVLADQNQSDYKQLLYPLAFSLMLSLGSCGTSAKTHDNNHVSESSHEVIAQHAVTDSSVYVIKGRLIDGTGDGVAFANVVLAKQSIGITTDINGNFLLEIQKNELTTDRQDLQFSYVGLATYSIPLKEVMDTEIEVFLEESMILLGDVYIIQHPFYKRWWRGIKSWF